MARKKRKKNTVHDQDQGGSSTTILPGCGPAEINGCNFNAVQGSQVYTTNYNSPTFHHTHNNSPTSHHTHNTIHNNQYHYLITVNVNKDCLLPVLPFFGRTGIRMMSKGRY
ncbi:hypothetical protein BT96DRAFT_942863 [Gymnopus androsaceus JB14]|uniref:Uncharacterized protein n=1 Tax=Gymnopus androsaceus JB14 TaxID=1447944 RepID=A0A6A4H9A4_9AGAR|nr:hypothetical protein BT96DRAFT_942863 [Gymnopus androsaceus JB14]